jgi:signal transduction histidine kinase
MNRSLRRLLPADLRGQVAGILFLGLALSQLMAAVLYIVLLPKWQRVLRPESAIVRIEMVARLLESVGAAQRPGLLRVWNDRDFRLTYDFAVPTSVVAERAHSTNDEDLRQQIATKLNKSMDDIWVDNQPTAYSPDSKWIKVNLRGGGAFEVVTPVGLEHRLGLVEQVSSVVFLLFVTAGLWLWLTWMVNAPLTRVAQAAERVGLDIQSPLMVEQGSAQLQRVIRAFNDMQLRLQRFLTDRTLMLGAIGHDLRTPLTRLRLRVETDRAVGEKAKMLADIESMESMLSSTLSFVRGVDDAEAHDAVDLAVLLQTVCDVVSDLGGAVEYVERARGTYRCRPQALMRALTNVIGNSVKYGRRANVSLAKTPGIGFIIEVEDEGPGIPDTEKAKVFEPFYRTAAAQEVDHQGMGLGLSIARSVVLGHGGTIELFDRSPCGLRVRIELPEASAQA